jgi:hypothetical protein
METTPVTTQPQSEEAIETEAPTYVFNARELARLTVYRAAVVARFYNENLEADFASKARLAA